MSFERKTILTVRIVNYVTQKDISVREEKDLTVRTLNCVRQKKS
jgi:hypothetical protein